MKKQSKKKHPAAVALGRRRVALCEDWSEHCRHAAEARSRLLTPEERSAIARLGGLAAQENRRRRVAAANKT